MNRWSQCIFSSSSSSSSSSSWHVARWVVVFPRLLFFVIIVEIRWWISELNRVLTTKWMDQTERVVILLPLSLSLTLFPCLKRNPMITYGISMLSRFFALFSLFLDEYEEEEGEARRSSSFDGKDWAFLFAAFPSPNDDEPGDKETSNSISPFLTSRLSRHRFDRKSLALWSIRKRFWPIWSHLNVDEIISSPSRSRHVKNNARGRRGTKQKKSTHWQIDRYPIENLSEEPNDWLSLLAYEFHLFSSSRSIQMEQTDRGNSPLLDADRTMDLRRSQINLLSAALDESNFYINEVSPTISRLCSLSIRHRFLSESVINVFLIRGGLAFTRVCQ